MRFLLRLLLFILFSGIFSPLAAQSSFSDSAAVMDSAQAQMERMMRQQYAQQEQKLIQQRMNEERKLEMEIKSQKRNRLLVILLIVGGASVFIGLIVFLVVRLNR